MKEHAGGASIAGFQRIPLEFSEDIACPIAVTTFDPSDLDQPADLFREALSRNESLEPLIAALVLERIGREREEVVSRLIELLITHRKPGLAAVAMGDAVGLFMTAEMSGPQRAKQFGVSKQDYQQLVKRMRERLGLRQTRTMRDDEAREKFRCCNYRQQQKAA